jgi:hypothetical protein
MSEKGANMKITKKIKEEYVKKLEECRRKPKDPESKHINADRILCELLELLGCEDVVKAYDNIRPKWYA